MKAEVQGMLAGPSCPASGELGCGVSRVEGLGNRTGEVSVR
jgi:hypothetical protein